jgi:hypothetical protein
MLKSLHRSAPLSCAAGEPDAWDSWRATEPRTSAAPWHTPHSDERGSSSDYARRRPRPLPSERWAAREQGAARPTRQSGNASADDFRNLARTIEDLRRGRAAAPESRAEPSPRHAEPPARTEPTRRPGWLDDVRESLGREVPVEAEPARAPARPGPAEGGDLADAIMHEIARVADKSDVARLEALMNDILQRLSALEDRRPAYSRERREAERVRRRGEHAAADGAAVTDYGETEARVPRRRLTGVPRPSAAPAQAAETTPARTRPRATTPRRLWP